MKDAELEVFTKALVAWAGLQPNYVGHVLSKMAERPELTVLKFHTTAVGDRMVLRYSEDPNWLYEVEIRAWRPEELEPESSTFMFPVKKT
jgi:hypothetical protein